MDHPRRLAELESQPSRRCREAAELGIRPQPERVGLAHMVAVAGAVAPPLVALAGLERLGRARLVARVAQDLHTTAVAAAERGMLAPGQILPLSAGLECPHRSRAPRFITVAGAVAPDMYRGRPLRQVAQVGAELANTPTPQPRAARTPAVVVVDREMSTDIQAPGAPVAQAS